MSMDMKRGLKFVCVKVGALGTIKRNENCPIHLAKQTENNKNLSIAESSAPCLPDTVTRE